MASAAGQAIGVVGGERSRKGAKRGAAMARREFKAPPAFQAGGGGFELLGAANNPLFKNLGALLGGNSLDELQPALRANALNTQRLQEGFAGQLGRSGLVGSGFGLGGNQAIAAQGAERSSDILAGLPQLRRANLATAFPFLQAYLGDVARRQSGRANARIDTYGPQAAAKAQSANNMGNMVGGMGGKGGGGGGK